MVLESHGLIRAIAPPALYGVAARLRRRLRHGKYYALNGIDKYLHRSIKHHGGFFVELGANDGVSQSNTLFFERELGWRGVLIEPALNNFLACIKNRAPDNSFYCAACVPYSYKFDHVWLTYCNLMTQIHGLETDVADQGKHIAAAAGHLRPHERSFVFPARATTLTAVLEDAGAPGRIDLLSLDVEGAELSVLRGVDHARFRFRHIVVECRDIARLEGYLEEEGYRLKDQVTKQDYLFEDVDE